MTKKSLLVGSLLPLLVTIVTTACDDSKNDVTANALTGGSAGETGAASGGSAGSGAAGEGNEGGNGGEAPATGGSESTFHGKVVDGAGAGVKGAKVLLEGKLYTTANDGTFDVALVGETYDLVVLPPGGSKTLSVWKNATRRDPVATVPGEHEVPTVQVSGSISGGTAFPNPEGTVTFVGFDCADGRRVPAQLVTAASFQIDVSWAKWGPASCRLLALQGTGSESSMGKITGFASRDLQLDDGDETRTGQNLKLESVTPTSVAIRHDHIATPYAMTVSWGPFFGSYDFQFSNADMILWTAHVPDDTIPVWADVSKDGMSASIRVVEDTVGILDTWGGIWGMSPQDGETTEQNPEFSVIVPGEDRPDGIYHFEYSLDSGHTVLLHTTEEGFHLPDLAPLGAELLGEVTWSGTYADNTSSVDELLGDEPLPAFSITTSVQSFTVVEALPE